MKIPSNRLFGLPLMEVDADLIDLGANRVFSIFFFDSGVDIRNFLAKNCK
jgi:hypothetical protein